MAHPHAHAVAALAWVKCPRETIRDPAARRARVRDRLLDREAHRHHRDRPEGTLGDPGRVRRPGHSEARRRPRGLAAVQRATKASVGRVPQEVSDVRQSGSPSNFAPKPIVGALQCGPGVGEPLVTRRRRRARVESRSLPRRGSTRDRSVPEQRMQCAEDALRSGEPTHDGMLQWSTLQLPKWLLEQWILAVPKSWH